MEGISIAGRKVNDGVDYKKCSFCGILKQKDDFYKQKRGKYGVHSICRYCSGEKHKVYTRSIKGLIRTIYISQKTSSRGRGHIAPVYSFDEFSIWVREQNNFTLLFDEWVKSGYIKSLIPSIDRINNKEGYSFNNIQLVTWDDNHNNQMESFRNGELKTAIKHRSVSKNNKSGLFINSYISLSSASRDTGIPNQNICKCCKGKRKTAGGYIWKYIS